MAIAYRVDAPCVVAKDQDGVLHHYYWPDSSAGSSVIPWLSDEQAERLIAEGLVTPFEIQTDEERDAIAWADRVDECAAALAKLSVPEDCGAPTAREALRAADLKFGNDVIAEAVKVRKAALSGTAAS